MKKLVIGVGIVSMLVCGCSTSTVVRTGKDGETFTFHNTRALWKTGHIEGKVTATGMSFSMDSSTTDAEAMATVVGAAVSAATKSAVP